MSDVIVDTLRDTLKLIPFLFLTYLIMEFLEHKTGQKVQKTVRRAAKFGPVIEVCWELYPSADFPRRLPICMPEE